MKDKPQQGQRREVKLVRLNGDSSWLIQIPIAAQSYRSESRKTTFNLLVDPWLNPSSQVDAHPLFSEQVRLQPSSFGSIKQLDHHLRSSTSSPSTHHDLDPPSGLDAILLSHPFTDHSHPQTLLDDESYKRYPFFTTSYSTPSFLGLIPDRERSSVEYHQLDQTSSNLDRVTSSSRALPQGVGMFHLPTREWSGPAWKKLHGAILILHSLSSSPESTSSILYTPHGTCPTSIPSLLSDRSDDHRDPSLSRILLHPFHRQSLPLLGPISLGFPNVIDLIRSGTYRPNLILSTHDEEKEARGLVGRLLSREVWDLQACREAIQELLVSEQHHPNTPTEHPVHHAMRVEILKTGQEASL
ncbi:hypothetical protein IE53DRAFT_386904 [Violaceomyces palustris]|uniref:Uncharacterized protein n=1 Tax=Violaceomyces palustris TaxID=1673888 RepID=A0ACD0NY61_9BASI|nr:hypothetical protein IE53DRAFT_386904 [Violaceomyces palustris]